MVEVAEGLTRIASKHSVDETVHRVQDLLKSKGVQIFAIVDHSDEAAKAGMNMPRTKVVIFGSPKAGTLMLAAPTLAIDLPLKVLVAEDDSGKVWITWNDPEYLRSRHGVPADLIQNFSGAIALLRKAAE